jgi:copper chaperone CopZ
MNEIEFDMIGFGCVSCVYSIEKLGRKIAGVVDIHASLAEKRVRVKYNGDRAAIVRQLTDVVSRIGHEIRERSA